MAKKNLFEDEEEEDTVQDRQLDPSETRLKINKPFAQQFEKRVQRQLIDKAKIKYGADFEKKMELERRGADDDDESSDALEEDSDGELINDKVSEKFITTLARIRTKDPRIYESKKSFFKEKDFDDVIVAKEKESRMTYADMIRKDAMQKMATGDDYASSEDDGTNKMVGETIADEQRRIRDEFKRAALALDDGIEEEDVDGMFTQKKKSALQIENENKEYEKFISKVAAKKEKKDKKNKDKKKGKDDIDALKNFWGDANKLDDTDKFLRKYIMTKGWVDRDDMEVNEDFEAEDEERDDEADRFEAKFNFRYEEADANQVTTYGRKVEGSLRQKDSKRADQRKEREERKKESRKQLDEEIKQIKTATKGALLDRIQKIQQISGTSTLKANINALLEEDFDDDKFTKQLEKQFDSDYYEEEDEDIRELKTYEKRMKKVDKSEQVQELEKFGLDKDDIKKHQKRQQKAVAKMEIEDDEEQNKSSEWSSEDDDEEEDDEVFAEKQRQLEAEDKDNVLNVKSNLPLAMKKNLKDAEISAMCENDKGADGLYLWWYCDNCKKGIQPGSNRFDCTECADYTLCKTCSDGQFHDHALKKQPVPKNCVPPTDAEILDILKEFQVCKKCSIKLDDYCEYYKLDSNEEVVLCEECYDLGDYRAKSLYSFVEAKQVDLEDLAERDPSKLKDHITDEEVQKLVDQYYSLDFEDIISGGIKTRFKYIDVKKDSYGLSDEQLLYADTDALNKFVSIKKLAPYREDQGKVKSKQMKNKMYLQSVEKSTKINRKIVKQDIERGLTTKEDLKLLKRKDKRKYLKQLEKEKQEKQSKKDGTQEGEAAAAPKLVLEDLSRTEKTNVSKNRLKSYGI